MLASERSCRFGDFVSLMCFMDVLASTKASSSVGNTGSLREAA